MGKGEVILASLIFLILFASILISAQNPTCTDTDGGLNYYVKGIHDFASDTPGGESSDYCDNFLDLSEWSCTSDVPIHYRCPNGCSNGACLSSDEEICIDSDGGKNPYSGGEVFIRGTSTSIRDFCEVKIGENAYNRTNSCEGPDCYIQEQWCDSSSQSFLSDHMACPNGCVAGGVCNKECVDSNYGYYFKGQATGPDSLTYEVVTLTDHCFDDTILSEATCGEDEYVKWYAYTCPDICKEGACIDEFNPLFGRELSEDEIEDLRIRSKEVYISLKKSKDLKVNSNELFLLPDYYKKLGYNSSGDLTTYYICNSDKWVAQNSVIGVIEKRDLNSILDLLLRLFGAGSCSVMVDSELKSITPLRYYTSEKNFDFNNFDVREVTFEGKNVIGIINKDGLNARLPKTYTGLYDGQYYDKDTLLIIAGVSTNEYVDENGSITVLPSIVRYDIIFNSGITSNEFELVVPEGTRICNINTGEIWRLQRQIDSLNDKNKWELEKIWTEEEFDRYKELSSKMEEMRCLEKGSWSHYQTYQEYLNAYHQWLESR